MKKCFRQLLALLLVIGCIGTTSVTVEAKTDNGQASQGISVEDKCGLKKGELVEDDSLGTVSFRRVYTRASETNYWKSFAGKYYYKQLPEYEKQMWDTLESQCIAIATGTDDAAAAGVTFDNGQAGLSLSELQEFLYIFKLSNPQYYFLDSSFGYSWIGNEMTGAIYLYDAFTDGAVRREITEAFCTTVDQWVSQVAAGNRAEEKVKLAHDLIAENVEYNFGDYDQSAFSVVCQDTTVCAGYAATLQLLLNPNGVLTTEVTSDDHAWNYVYLHGNWYLVDVTFDDQGLRSDGVNRTFYNYYVKSSQTAQNASGNHYPESMWDGLLPEVKYDATLSSYDRYYSPYFSAGNYVYFIVNDNTALANRYATAVEAANGASLSNAPRSVSYNTYNYEIVNTSADNTTEEPAAPTTPPTAAPAPTATPAPTALNGLRQAADGNWYYYVNGQVDTGRTGLVYDETVGWWYIENGVINFNYNGLIPYADAWWCVAGGRVVFDYTGLWSDPNVGWWYVENGTINFNYNGLIPYADAWWCVAGGQVHFEYTGLWSDPNVGWWYVENGTINFNYNGLIPYADAWWCVAGGQVCFGYTGLWSDPNVGWWYVENGVINFNYTGVVEYNGAMYNVVNGMVVF